MVCPESSRDASRAATSRRGTPMWWRELSAQEREFGELPCHGSVPDVHESAHVSPSATLDTARGPILVGARTRICDGACIQGPVIIGADCLIGNLVMVRGSTSVGDYSRIGFASEIKNAILEDGVTIGPQSFAADSKIERGAYLGAQVRTSNHRLDRRKVEVVVNGRRVDQGLEKLGCIFGACSLLGHLWIIMMCRDIWV